MESVKLNNSKEDMDNFLNFITKRPYFERLKSESLLVDRQRSLMYPYLKDKDLNCKELYEKVKNAYYKSLITPGDCVGISGAQAMGEFSTQATLNTFHIAGFDTGINRGVNRFQEIINASKNPKNVECRIYFNKKMTSDELKFYNIVCILFKDVVKNMYMNFKEYSWYKPCHLIFSQKVEEPLSVENYHIFRYELRKEILYKYYIYPADIKYTLENIHCKITCIFSPLTKRGRCYFDIFIPKEISLYEVRSDLLPKIETTRVSGLQSVTSAIYEKINDEWVVDTIGGTLKEFATIPIVDLERTTTNSIWDIYNVLGIEAVKRFLLNELLHVMHGVDIHNIALLVCRMTHSGTISSITRYTMRNENGPMIKASFEESMETFIKAGKYGEVDNFKGVSTAIIGGKKPKIGTNAFNLLVDLSKI